MTTLQFHCPQCAGLFQTDAALAGQMVACPLCGSGVVLPPRDALFPHTPPPTPVMSAAPLQLGCPRCGGGFLLPPEYAGQEVACPHCHQGVMAPPLQMPAVTTPPPAPQPPPEMPRFEPPPPLSPPMTLSPPPPLTTPPVVSSRTSQPEQAYNAPPTTFLYPPGFEPPGAKQEPKSPTTSPPSRAAEPPSSNFYPPGMAPAAKAAPEPKQEKAEPKPKQEPKAEPKPKQEPKPVPKPVPETKAHKEKSREERQRWSAPTPSEPAVPQPATPVPAVEKVTPTPRAKVDELLPPGAADIDALLPPGSDVPLDVIATPVAPVAPLTPSQVKKEQRSEALLPPGGEVAPSAPLQQVALPEEEMERQLRAQNRPKKPDRIPEDAIVIPTETGEYVALHEPVKTIGYGDNERELKVLTPEEKQRRRFVRNLIMYTFGLTILCVAFWLLMKWK